MKKNKTSVIIGLIISIVVSIFFAILFLYNSYIYIADVVNCKTGSCSGFFILALPILIIWFLVCGIPSWVSTILYHIYYKKDKKILLIFSTIAAFFSIVLLLSIPSIEGIVNYVFIVLCTINFLYFILLLLLRK